MLLGTRKNDSSLIMNAKNEERKSTYVILNINTYFHNLISIVAYIKKTINYLPFKLFSTLI